MATYWNTERKLAMLQEMQERNIETVTSKQLEEEFIKNGIPFPNWLGKHRVSRGIYRLPFELITGVAPVLEEESVKTSTETAEVIKDKVLATEPEQVPVPAPNVTQEIPADAYIPDIDPNYVKFGHHIKLQKVLKSGIFYPVFITGLSGNGKTHMVEQVSAGLERECVRVNITVETDEMDLIGGFRLYNGQTVWEHGPVIHAMERGAILLLDEVDLASNKIMCLQSVLEGNGVFIKKISKFIQPAEGFNIVATANTKGRGDDTGMFMGANVLNEAFLERFAITLEQNYASKSSETKILMPYLPSEQEVAQDSKEFCDKLVNWSEMIRKTYQDGGIEDIITTRRLIFICKTYSIFDDRETAIQMCLDRFDEETKNAFWDLYRMLDDNLENNSDSEEVNNAEK